MIIYAGSLVNPKLLEYTKDVCTIHNSANKTLEEVIQVIEKARKRRKDYGASPHRRPLVFTTLR